MIQPMTDLETCEAELPIVENSSSSDSMALLGIPFANISTNSALQQILNALESGQQHRLFFVNAHSLNIAFSNSLYRQALKEAEMIFPDGSGIRLGCNLNGASLIENLNGTDLFPLLCHLFAWTQIPIFLLGAKPGTAERVSDWACQHAPNLRVAGTHHGFFTKDEESTVIEKINQSGAKVLLVAMGVPQQELWINQHQSTLSTQLNIAVGGLFDFYGGNIPRAPKWLREAGFEWLWRLRQEPKRMWKRYIVGNPLFTARIWQEKRTKAFITSFPDRLMRQQQRFLMAVRAIFTRSRHYLSYQSLHYSKRSTDLVLASTALLLLLPLLVCTALCIRCSSAGPIFFRQQRAGLRGRPFILWKFRSMYQDAERRQQELEACNEMKGGVLFKIKNDPRVTPFGRFIRRYSIDELPQLWNVVRGEMSIVGPRPALYSELDQYDLLQRQRLDVMPGLTSEWAVSGRSDLPFSEQARLDIAYRYQRSFWRDFKLMIRTIPAILSGRGAS